MSKDKVVDVKEYEEIKDIEKEVEEAHAEIDAKQKEKIPFKDRAKKVGKEALKIFIGGVVGFGSAVALGWAMSKSEESCDNDDCGLLEEGESEETYDGE